jgi:acylphosphatase
VRRLWLVSGRVQGVGFRRFVQRRAEELGLAGHAANLADGRVEVLADGDAERLERLLAHLRRGPAHARVTEVQELPAPEGTTLSGFATR